MLPRTLVQVHGMPPFLSWREAGRMLEAAGQAQGGPADASSGLTIHNDDRGSWAFNPLYSQWQLLHIVQSGDTLWALSGRYYGERSMAGVHVIGRVEQNRPILGASYDQAIPGDVILIPDLEQPGASPPAPPPPGAVPAPGGDPVPGPGEPPVPGAPPPVVGLPTQPPPGWPPGMPWPPVEVPTQPPETPPGDEQAPDILIPGQPPGAPPVLVGGAPAEPPPPKEPSWWTTPRVAIVGGLAAATVIAAVWAASRRPKKRRAPRRRRRR